MRRSVASLFAVKAFMKRCGQALKPMMLTTTAELYSAQCHGAPSELRPGAVRSSGRSLAIVVNICVSEPCRSVGR